MENLKGVKVRSLVSGVYNEKMLDYLLPFIVIIIYSRNRERKSL